MSDNSEYAAPVPRAVREQAERAEQLARDIGMANVPENPNPDLNPEGTPQRPEGGAAVAPSDQPAQEGGGELERASPPPEGGDQGNQRTDDWEQRYRTLQGKYDRELGQTRGQAQALQSQVDNLQRIISTMQAAPTPAPASAAPSPTPVVTQEDREMWGDELPVAVSRWAAEAVAPRVQQLEAENARLANELDRLRGGQQEQSQVLARNSFEAQLDMDPQLSSGVWRQLNSDDKFIAWLQITEPYSGQLRLNLLRDAAARGDALRAGQFFKDFLAEHTAPPASSSAPHTGQNGAPVPAAGRRRLEDMAAPGRAAASGTNGGASPEKRIWTNREIGAFYRDVQRGVYRGREADQARTEQDIVTAASEGRVTQ